MKLTRSMVTLLKVLIVRLTEPHVTALLLTTNHNPNLSRHEQCLILTTAIAIEISVSLPATLVEEEVGWTLTLPSSARIGGLDWTMIMITVVVFPVPACLTMTGEDLVHIDHRLIDVGPTPPLEEASLGMTGVTMEVVVEGSAEVFVPKTGPNLLLEMRGLKGG